MFAKAGAAGTAVYPPWREIYSSASVPEPLKKRTPRIFSNLGSRMTHPREILSLRQHLVVNPAIGILHPLAQADRRLPFHNLLDPGVVAVPAHHAFWCAQI